VGLLPGGCEDTSSLKTWGAFLEVGSGTPWVGRCHRFFCWTDHLLSAVTSEIPLFVLSGIPAIEQAVGASSPVRDELSRIEVSLQVFTLPGRPSLCRITARFCFERRPGRPPDPRQPPRAEAVPQVVGPGRDFV